MRFFPLFPTDRALGRVRIRIKIRHEYLGSQEGHETAAPGEHVGHVQMINFWAEKKDHIRFVVYLRALLIHLIEICIYINKCVRRRTD